MELSKSERTPSFYDPGSVRIDGTFDLQLIPNSSVDFVPCDFDKTFVHIRSLKCRRIDMYMYSYMLYLQSKFTFSIALAICKGKRNDHNTAHFNFPFSGLYFLQEFNQYNNEALPRNCVLHDLILLSLARDTGC